jgi:hypothetical protein
MDKQSPVALDQENVSNHGCFGGNARYLEDLSGPDRRQHAASLSNETDGATGTQNFGCQADFLLFAIFGQDRHGRLNATKFSG